MKSKHRCQIPERGLPVCEKDRVAHETRHSVQNTVTP